MTPALLALCDEVERQMRSYVEHPVLKRHVDALLTAVRSHRCLEPCPPSDPNATEPDPL